MAGTELDLRPGYDPLGISDQMIGSVLEPAKWGISMYYRNPLGWREGTESLWIAYDDTDPYLILRKIRKGYQLLERYGPCPGFGPPNNKGQRHRQAAELWTPILSHPEGPSEFPPDQVKTFRWYRPQFLPGSLAKRKISFPQLVEAVRSGTVELTEIGCPECRNRRSFFEPWHLAKHLSVQHGYTIDQVFALGRELGVDFRQTLKLIFDPIATTELEDLVRGSDTADGTDLPINVTTVASQARKSYSAPSHEHLAPIAIAPDPTTLALAAEVERLQGLLEERDAADAAARMDPLEGVDADVPMIEQPDPTGSPFGPKGGRKRE